MQNELALEQMIEQQVRAVDVLDERVLTTLRKVPREQFVPARYSIWHLRIPRFRCCMASTCCAPVWSARS